MLKLKDYTYERPNVDQVEKDFCILIEKLRNADSVEDQISAINEINSLRSEIGSMGVLVDIRYNVNTDDSFYSVENDFFNDFYPQLEGHITEYYKELINSKFRKELEDIFGKHLFDMAEVSIECFKPEIIEDLQEENKLSTQYTRLKASAKIMFEGEEMNLSQLSAYTESADREMRKKSQEAITTFFVENEDKFDEIYDRLVKVRHRIAKKLGYDSFIELAYKRMGRIDYDANMVAEYRKQVLESLVPLTVKLREQQAERLGVEELKYYDQALAFLNGNPTPKGDSDWIVAQAKKMYEELSPETSEFINFMIDRELMDLVAKKGKSGGGYCTYISKYKSPFVFSNFNGTYGDVDILTHEIGHAFQKYCVQDFEVPDYIYATSETAEVHSIGMEFLAWPWMESFFEEDVEKYKFNHVNEAILFIPYGVTVDEFQHRVFENPEMTPAERKAVWRELEKKYLPYKDYDGVDFYERGGFFFKQSHIYDSPFYYIDYTLAKVCAFQLWAKSRENREEAWEDYLNLCKVGGSKPFLQALKVANIDNPFVSGTIEKVVKPLENYLNSVDCTNF